ncbi:hypothetical protein LVD17_06825 [Fulvivirga ulvae]|uniref:hypothetical protein n=1 Tax=Fulvivirga ulvae TaxID=2904245 RepID=UPI001F342B45|nr:hypothetical protein [Fulvivirga ulvae]UII33535.1 hypothetical protein LVD17_06825 [Fulvivirga ulvae]
MHLYLHIRIIKDQFNFKNDTIDKVRSWLPHVSLFDVDNYSDNTTIQTAIRAMEMADKIFIQIEAEQGPEPGGVLKILNTAMRKSSAVIDYRGSHAVMDKIMIRFKDRLTSSDRSQQQKLADFFNDGS